MTRKLIFTAVLAVALLGLGGGANAQTVVGTDHDLSSKASNTDQVCVFCHSPHTVVSAVNVETPLWNRRTDDTGFTMYTSPTLDMVSGTAPQGVSLACLSCHDGTIGFDQLLGGLIPDIPPGDNFITGDELIGKDLRGDHPISITYDPALDAGFNAKASVINAGLPLFGTGANQVECASCHNPHDDTQDKFMRMSNAASALCTTCHIK